MDGEAPAVHDDRRVHLSHDLIGVPEKVEDLGVVGVFLLQRLEHSHGAVRIVPYERGHRTEEWGRGFFPRGVDRERRLTEKNRPSAQGEGDARYNKRKYAF
jgi:hypothetical protein